MVIDREVIKKLAIHLKRYNEYKQEILDIEEEIINSSKGDINQGIRSINKISRSTENVAIKLATNKRIKYLKRWIKCIDDLLIELLKEPVKLKIIKYKYIDLKPGEKISDIKVIEKIDDEGYPMNKDLYYELKEQVFYKFEKIAIYQHLLK